MRRLLQQAPKLGAHVRRLIIQPRLDEQAVPDIDKLDPCIVDFLCYLPNVEELVVWSIPRDTHPHPVLLNAFGALLPALRRVELQEDGFRPEYEYGRGHGLAYPEKPQDAVANTWQNHLNVTLLLYRASTLTHVTIVSRLPLHATVFLLLRDSASALQAIALTGCIGRALQPIVAQPVRWACAPSLRSLALHQCRGVHAPTLVRHIAAGRLGALEQLTVHACGDPDPASSLDSSYPHPPPMPYNYNDIDNAPGAWAPPPLRIVSLSRCDARAYAMLHAETLVVPRAELEAFLHPFAAAAAAADQNPHHPHQNPHHPHQNPHPHYQNSHPHPHPHQNPPNSDPRVLPFPGLRRICAPLTSVSADTEAFPPPHLWLGMGLLKSRGIALEQDAPVAVSCSCPMH
jgi:hypothetical protein